MKTSDLAHLHNEFIAIRKQIHQNPELGFNEIKTASLVASKLKEFGYEVYESIGVTGVVGVLKKGKQGKSIALRADMDALKITECAKHDYASKNGCMHACGHDGHTASLLMAAKYLSDKDFNGTLNLIFQPAEECCDESKLSGAMRMVKAGLFDRFKSDFVFGYHNMPSSQMKGYEDKLFFLKKGVMMAGVSAYKITFKGLGGHASAPHLCKDPIAAMNTFISALYTFKSLQIAQNTTCVINVTGVIAGNTNAFNIVPNDGVVMVNVRSLDNEQKAFIHTRINEIAQAAANAHSISVEVDRKENIDATINEDKAQEFAINVAKELFGESNCEENHPYLMGSEDFSAMLACVKGAYAFINNSNSANLHHPEYVFNDEVMLNASAYYSALVLKYLA